MYRTQQQFTAHSWNQRRNKASAMRSHCHVPWPSLWPANNRARRAHSLKEFTFEFDYIKCILIECGRVRRLTVCRLAPLCIAPGPRNVTCLSAVFGPRARACVTGSSCTHRASNRVHYILIELPRTGIVKCVTDIGRVPTFTILLHFIVSHRFASKAGRNQK